MEKIGLHNTKYSDFLLVSLTLFQGVVDTHMSQEKNKVAREYSTQISKANEVLKASIKEEDASLSLYVNRLCLDLQRSLFAHSEKEHALYDKYIDGNLAARNSLGLVLDKEAYKKSVHERYGKYREVKFAPAGEVYRTFGENQIVHFGKMKLGQEKGELKDFFELSQQNMRAGINHFVTLQNEALGLQNPTKEKSLSKDLGRTLER